MQCGCGCCSSCCSIIVVVVVYLVDVNEYLCQFCVVFTVAIALLQLAVVQKQYPNTLMSDIYGPEHMLRFFGEFPFVLVAAASATSSAIFYRTHHVYTAVVALFSIHRGIW